MVRLTHGNLLKADAEALVNTVNCVGYMGKGIALQFKQAFPSNFAVYEHACKLHEVQPGRMLIYERDSYINPKYIINFPTKRHWRGKSKLEDIRKGLDSLVQDVKRLGIKTIAIPPLGCGNGGLEWSVVRPMIEKAFGAMPEVNVSLYPPEGAPDSKSMPVNTRRPDLTVARALLIRLMDAYKALDYNRTLLEVQKLAYFLQSAGQPLRLRYSEGHYGPYAPNLNNVLELIEGHYIRGYGSDQKPETEIELAEGAAEQAASFLSDESESLERLKRVEKLIEGFETPYGMELLATVHWVATHEGPQGETPARNSDEAIARVHLWNPRKKHIFRPQHIRTAWEQLFDHRWIEGNSVNLSRAAIHSHH
jgi:O-acetyl-ADP-ribose deacetylase (regulator of RNase III)